MSQAEMLDTAIIIARESAERSSRTAALAQTSAGVISQNVEAAGLLPDEVDLLRVLCDGLTTYPTYDTLRQESKTLQDIDPERVTFEPYYAVASNGDPIGVTTVRGAHAGNGRKSAYLESDQHATEPIGRATSAVLKVFFALGGGAVLDRNGYEKVIMNDHPDPVGESMQLWLPRQPRHLAEFVGGACRGPIHGQLSWGYLPPARYADMTPENRMSYDLLTQDHAFVGLLHGGIFGNYAMASHAERKLADDLSHILMNSTLPVPSENTEGVNSDTLAPGVLRIVGRDHLDALGAPEGIGEYMSAIDFVSPDSLILIPEVGWTRTVASVNPGKVDYPGAVMDRVHLVQECLDVMDSTLEKLARQRLVGETTTERLQGNPYLQMRTSWLEESVRWYLEFESACNASDRDGIASNTAAEQGRQLTHRGHIEVLGSIAVNALSYTANAARLAGVVGDIKLHDEVKEWVRRRSLSLEPTHNVSIPQQVALQALLVLAGMRHAANR